MDRAGEWRRLCELLDEDETVWQAVESALQEGADPWEALLDGLDDAGVLAYLQAEDTGMELSDALAQLPRVFELQPDLDAVTDTDDLSAAMRAADRALGAGGLRLLRLVEEDDAESWPLVAVPVAAFEEVVRLAAALDHRAEGA
jgi:hypothetical protein